MEFADHRQTGQVKVSLGLQEDGVELSCTKCRFWSRYGSQNPIQYVLLPSLFPPNSKVRPWLDMAWLKLLLIPCAQKLSLAHFSLSFCKPDNKKQRTSDKFDSWTGRSLQMNLQSSKFQQRHHVSQLIGFCHSKATLLIDPLLIEPCGEIIKLVD